MSRFTSWTLVPLPLAMRFLRLAFKRSGFARSAFVMDWMMALVRASCFSSTCTFPSLEAPGIILSMSSMEPMFCICSIWSRKSLRSKDAVRIFFSISAAFFSSKACWAFSMRVKTSPMPKIREAIRSGWKGSMSVSFSPVPANLMGLPVTAFTDRAAPPRVSPSSLVRITPVRGTASWKALAAFTASWPVMASMTRRTSAGFKRSRSFLSSLIMSSSTWSRPAVSTMSTS